ncbi:MULTISPECIES: hypothetical protein [Micromonospora]|uniref:DUF4034 domain-containing protein n=1 Tax=Micromonospora yangpuensis TaxID=683228 RepID=A0A1C6V8T1_9ACTN|nr:hypothetical protein [Micromonospora yangpuensis]GGM32004.1 hypothetical protein GCM10012279_58620 [Micromonospora yangpuensis]SCL62761.1 hypothetical protein GA0070617_5014 [Micromonospora yangpuensis]
MWPFRRRARQEQQESPALSIDPAQGDPTAEALIAAFELRDWPTARDLLTPVTDPDDRAFCLGVVAQVDGVQDWIGEWIDAEPRSTLPMLVKGAHALHRAGQARGSARAAQTSQEQFREFHKGLKFAENCLDEVVDRDPEDVTARALLVQSARGRQVDPAEARRRFDAVVERYPWHRVAHEAMLQYLCRKWSGSHEEMFEFARGAAAKAPAGSTLGKLVMVAHLEMWVDLPIGEDADYIGQPEVLAELNAAADHSVRHPDYRRRPGWPNVHNAFAMAFAMAGDLSSAAEQFEVIGDLVTPFPWQYHSSDPVGSFLAQRDRVGAED